MSEKKLPGLDGLRAIAVALVLLFHRFLLPVGWIGVQIFFVLSGYLITRLLDRARAQPLASYLREFYGRRALRIFPLYYAALLVIAVLAWGSPELAGLGFAATYTYNFWYATQAHEFSMLITHFWTLCVEEQFYLIWPFVIFFTPPHVRRAVLSAIVLAGPGLRLLGTCYLARPGATVLFDPSVALDTLTPSHIDAFATGALVALYPLRSPRLGLGLSAALLALGGFVVLRKYHLPLLSFGYPIGLSNGFGFLWGFSLINVTSAFLIASLVERRFLPALFEARPLAYLGRISYGLYVIHYPMQHAVDVLLPHSRMALKLAAQIVLTVIFAALSFKLWEAPFLRLKDRWFKVTSAAPVAPAA